MKIQNAMKLQQAGNHLAMVAKDLLDAIRDVKQDRNEETGEEFEDIKDLGRALEDYATAATEAGCWPPE